VEFLFFLEASKEREKHTNASSRLQIKSTRDSYLATTTSVKHAIKYSRIIITTRSRRRRRFFEPFTMRKEVIRIHTAR
jgi:hypothetical protein